MRDMPFYYGPFAITNSTISHVVDGEYPDAVITALRGHPVEMVFVHRLTTGTPFGALIIENVKVRRNIGGLNVMHLTVENNPMDYIDKEELP